MTAVAKDAREAVRAWLLTIGDAKYMLLDFVREALGGNDKTKRHTALQLLRTVAELSGQFHGRWREDWKQVAVHSGVDETPTEVWDADVLAVLTEQFGVDLPPEADRRMERPRIGTLPRCSELTRPNRLYLSSQDSALFQQMDEQKQMKVDRMFAH